MWPSLLKCSKIATVYRASTNKDIRVIQNLSKDQKEAIDALVILSDLGSKRLADIAQHIVESQYTRWKLYLNENELLLKDSDNFGNALLLVVFHDMHSTTFKHPFDKWESIEEFLFAIIALQFHATQYFSELD